MGSLIDKIREDEEEYYWICKELGIKTPHDENMYVHDQQKDLQLVLIMDI